jgi:pimeloyl-ACP methyl ester carboxylesterase
VDNDHRQVPAPPLLYRLLEHRAVYETGAFIASSPVLRLAGRGDRHPVLVLPGFTASDRSTEPLRWFLRGQGYWVHGWQLGRNLGPTERTLEGLSSRLQELHDRHGRPVSVIGWSLGGIYARMLAHNHPELVRQVITLGSPFRMQQGDHSHAEALWQVLAPGFPPDLDALFDSVTPLPVPSTAIYSKTDGVVAWYTCIETLGPRRESIEVRGSHMGLGVHPAALWAVADRLAQREGTWKPFRAPLALRQLFPRPETYRTRDQAA